MCTLKFEPVSVVACLLSLSQRITGDMKLPCSPLFALTAVLTQVADILFESIWVFLKRGAS